MLPENGPPLHGLCECGSSRTSTVRKGFRTYRKIFVSYTPYLHSLQGGIFFHITNETCLFTTSNLFFRYVKTN